MLPIRSIAILALWAVTGAVANAGEFEYRLVSTTKTSTAEKEMNEAAAAGFAVASVMGGKTAFGWREVVVVMQRDASSSPGAPRRYRLLGTTRTSTMLEELRQLGGEGFEYKGQTVFETAFRSREVVVIMEKDPAKPLQKSEYRLLATSRTSTMQKELQDAGREGFSLVGLTVAETFFGGPEQVVVLKRAIPAPAELRTRLWVAKEPR